MLYVIGFVQTRTDEAARARVAPSMAFDADSANNRGSPLRVSGPRFPFVYSSLVLRYASDDGWAGAAETTLACGFGSISRRRPKFGAQTSSTLLPRNASDGEGAGASTIDTERGEGLKC